MNEIKNSTYNTLPPLRLLTLDISGETIRHVVVARGTPELYQGHADTVLLPDQRTMFCVWSLNHGWGEPLLRRSDDAGMTWHDAATPEDWNTWQKSTDKPHSSLGGAGRGWLPMIHYLTDPQGRGRLFIFDRGKDDMLIQAVSENGGQTWTPMCPNGLHGIEPSMNINLSCDGRKLVMWNTDWTPGVYQAESFDGGLTWTNEREVIATDDLPGVKMVEPGVIRSPDGSRLLMLIRDFTIGRTYNSLFAVSEDEGQTWSRPRRLSPELTGDRHCPIYAPDGRLVVFMRDMLLNGSSPTEEHFIAWVGTWDDIVPGRPGKFRVKLLHNHAEKVNDCGYSSAQLTADGSFVATTYLKYASGPELHSVVSVRFNLDELDAMFADGKNIQHPLPGNI